MVYPVTMYAAKCDNCERDAVLGSGEFSALHETYDVENDLRESNWFVGSKIDGEHEGKHYCSKCFAYDDNDKLVLNPLDAPNQIQSKEE